MGRIKRGNYIFIFYKTDHSPNHVHVFRGKIQVAKVAIPDIKVLSGAINSKIRNIIIELVSEGNI